MEKDRETNNEEKFTLNYFNPIETRNKIYNKVLIKNDILAIGKEGSAKKKDEVELGGKTDEY